MAERVMTFVSESQLEEAKANRGPRVDDGTALPARPLFEVLRENRHKQDAEFKDRFKHRPPKALDEEETDFLERWEMVKRDQEKKVADEEAQELVNFHAAVASKTVSVDELRPSVERLQAQPQNAASRLKRASQASIVASLIKVKPQPKKSRIEDSGISADGKSGAADVDNGLTGLVAYQSDDDE